MLHSNPTQWQEGIKLNVSIKELVQGQEKTREVVVPVPKYDGKYTNYLNIHFLRGGKAKGFILGTTMTSAGYPLKGAEADLGGYVKGRAGSSRFLIFIGALIQLSRAFLFNRVDFMVLFNNRLARASCFLSIIVSLTLGCTSKAATRPSTILGYNHTSNTIMEYRMTLATGESANGMSLLPHQGGGSFVCCMPMPRKWTDNLKVTVNIMERIKGKDRERQVVVHIPRYDSDYMNFTNVHFLRGGAVKIFVLGTGMRDENYPLTAEEADLGGPK